MSYETIGDYRRGYLIFSSTYLPLLQYVIRHLTRYQTTILSQKSKSLYVLRSRKI